MTKLNPDQILALAEQYETKKEFREKEPAAYRRAHRLGMLDQIKLKDQRGKWTRAKLRNVARRYSTRGEFRDQDRLAYNAASRLGCLDHICSHMDQNPSCDRDTIYIARYRGTNHYKIGLTSSRRGLDRLAEQTLDLDVVIYAQLRWSAEYLERKLLGLGEPGPGNEVRTLDKAALERAMFLVTQAVLENQTKAT